MREAIALLGILSGFAQHSQAATISKGSLRRLVVLQFEFVLSGVAKMWIGKAARSEPEFSRDGSVGGGILFRLGRLVCKRQDGLAVSATVRLGLLHFSRAHAFRGNTGLVPKHWMGPTKQLRALLGLR